jgi:hypothetical protein
VPSFVSQPEVLVTSWVELLTLTVISTGLGTFWHKHNCHEHRCLRLSWHPDGEGHPVCKVHHADSPRRKLSWEVWHFLTTGQAGDHSHPAHARSRNAHK